MSAPLLGLVAAAAGIEIAAQISTVIIAFLIVMAILKALAWGPILKALDERRENIANQFDQIEKRQAELAAKIKDYDARLSRIDDEARERMNKAIDEGRRIAAELTEKARKDAEDIAARAQASIQLEVDKARIDLRDEIVRIAIEASEKLMRAKLDDGQHRQLVGSFVSEIEKRRLS